MSSSKGSSLARRKKRIRGRLSGTEERPRMTVYRSLKHIYAQVIDDRTGRTLVAASTLSKEIRDAVKTLPKKAAAEKVGELVAQACLSRNVKKVAFDRNGYLYHGRVSALAAAARKAGLQF